MLIPIMVLKFWNFSSKNNKIKKGLDFFDKKIREKKGILERDKFVTFLLQIDWVVWAL
jgi:hypothetical protein